MESPTTILNNGATIPLIGLGTWQDFGGAPHGQTKASVLAALEAGYRHIDCAAAYKNQEEVGEAITEFITSGKATRKDIWVTSKVWMTCFKPEHVRGSLEQTLQELKLEYLDLLLLHFPFSLEFTGYDLKEKFPLHPNGLPRFGGVPLATTWQAMEALVDAGKVRTIGVSNFSILQVVDLMASARIPPAVNQIEIHPHHVREDLVSYCQQLGVHVTGYSIFGSNQAAMIKLPEVLALAEKHNKTPGQVIIRWCIDRGVSCIPKSRDPQRLASNMQISDFVLSTEDINSLNRLDKRVTVFDRQELWGFNPIV